MIFSATAYGFGTACEFADGARSQNILTSLIARR
jgi:hypothetical protein